MNKDYKCECGFQFSKPGEFRNAQAIITKEGNTGVICPNCGKVYIFEEDNL
jgi:predicted RNA-binding Zn-ribbon protein involved in translation (DUF1610 family)